MILPVRDGEPHIAEQLSALAAQTYRGAWELVVVDNGCRDRSMAIVETFRDRLPALAIADACDRPGLGHARNCGAETARGELLAFCDADDVAAPGWLEALVTCATGTDLVGGLLDYEHLNSRAQRTRDSAESIATLFSGYGFLPYPSGGNCAVWADVAREIRWDESFSFGSSDIEFGWRAQLAGFRVAFCPVAVMHVRLRSDIWALARQYFRYGKSEPFLFRRFRRLGMPRSDMREALGVWAWLAREAYPMLRSVDGRGRWVRVAGSKAGRLYGSARWLVVFP